MREETVHFIIRIICVALPIALFVTFFYFICKFYLSMSQKKNERMLQKAIAAGHVVKGRLINTKIEWWLDNSTARLEDDTKMVRVGTYEYEYKGKTYRRKLYTEADKLPKELDLYFIKNPKKVAKKSNIASSDLGTGKCFWRVFIFISFIEACSYLSQILN